MRLSALLWHIKCAPFTLREAERAAGTKKDRSKATAVKDHSSASLRLFGYTLPCAANKRLGSIPLHGS